MKFTRCLILSIILLTACGSKTPATSALPTPQGPQAKIVDLINQVEAHALAEAAWAPAIMDTVIYLGGEVRALEASTARLRIEETLVRVAPNTLFTFNQPSDDKLQIDLQEGQVWLNVEGLEPGQEFEVQTPTATAAVRGTRFSARVQPDGSSLFSVVKGSVDVTGAGVTVSVPEGQQSSVAPGQPPSEPAPISLPEAIRWGMGFGPNLDAVLPAYGEPVLTQEKGVVTDGPFYSSDGKWLFYHIFDPSTGADSYNSLWNLDEKNTVPISLPEGAFQVSFNPLDGRIAYADGENICTSQVDGSDQTCFNGSDSYKNVKWSPDGQRLLFSNFASPGESLFVSKPDGSEFDILAGSSSGYSLNGAWSPDSSKVAYVQTTAMTATGELWAVNADASGSQQLFTDVPKAYYAKFAWNPDGVSLAATGAQGLSVVNLDGSSTPLDTGAGIYSSLAWSPNQTGWPLFYSSQPDGVYTSYLLTDEQAQPSQLGNWQYGPYWMEAGSAMLLGNTSLVVDGDNSYLMTEFYRFQTNYDFMQ